MLEQMIPNFAEEQNYLDRVVPAGWIIGINADFINPEHLVNRFPPEWNKEYVENRYFFKDPIVAWVSSFEGARRWSEVQLPDPIGIFEKAGRYGLVFGAAISKELNGRRSFITGARKDRELTDAEIAALDAKLATWLNILYSYEPLTPDELAALKTQRDGMGYKDAATLLGISVDTIKVRLARARAKLRATDTTNAVSVAMAKRDFG